MPREYPIKTVPNQRVIAVQKSPTDQQHKYTKNNLSALDEAANRLQTKAGFKLYIYLAKNQDKYRFAFSSADFTNWSGVQRTAYQTAFSELVSEGYLIQHPDNETHFTFYDKSQKPRTEEAEIVIDYAERKPFIF